jgi:hypothetical protein
VTSGSNVRFDQLRYVAERSLLGQKREALLCVQVPTYQVQACPLGVSSVEQSNLPLRPRRLARTVP